MTQAIARLETIQFQDASVDAIVFRNIKKEEIHDNLYKAGVRYRYGDNFAYVLLEEEENLTLAEAVAAQLGTSLNITQSIMKTRIPWSKSQTLQVDQDQADFRLAPVCALKEEERIEDDEWASKTQERKQYTTEEIADAIHKWMVKQEKETGEVCYTAPNHVRRNIPYPFSSLKPEKRYREALDYLEREGRVRKGYATPEGHRRRVLRWTLQDPSLHEVSSEVGVTEEGLKSAIHNWFLEKEAETEGTFYAYIHMLEIGLPQPFCYLRPYSIYQDALNDLTDQGILKKTKGAYVDGRKRRMVWSLRHDNTSITTQELESPSPDTYEVFIGTRLTLSDALRAFVSTWRSAGLSDEAIQHAIQEGVNACIPSKK